jgi:uracil-DNA glycosylase
MVKRSSVMDNDDVILGNEIAACTFCAAHLPLGPRPVTQFSATSRILIIGQAPGTKVHASGVPWHDDSGDRLREWTGLDNHNSMILRRWRWFRWGSAIRARRLAAMPRRAPNARRDGMPAFSTCFPPTA